MLGGFLGRLAKRLRRRAPDPPPFQDGGFKEWSIRGVRFDDQPFRPGVASPSAMSWTDADGAAIELIQTADRELLHHSAIPRYRDEQRRVAQANGRGIVSVNLRSNRQGAPVLEVITKARHGLGYDYVGSLSCTDGQQGCTISIVADEGGSTGGREAVVSAQLFELGELRPPHGPPSALGQPIAGWGADPYDPQWDDGAQHAVSDDERLDVLFPAHPLSRVRAGLSALRETLLLTDPSALATAPMAETGYGPAAAERGSLSAAAVREVCWKFERFDLILESLNQELGELDGPDGDRDQRVADLVLLIGVVQARCDRHLDARSSLARAAGMFAALLGESHVRTAVALTHLARCHLALGNAAGAAPVFMRVLPVLETGLPKHLVLGMAHSGYGRLLLDRGSADRGLEHVMRAQEISEGLGGGTRYFLLQETAGGPAPVVLSQITIVAPA